MKMKHISVNGLMTPVELVHGIDFVLHLQLIRSHPTNGLLPHVASCQNSDQSAHGIAFSYERQPAAELDTNCCQRGTVCLHQGQMLPFQLWQIPARRCALLCQPTVQELWNSVLKSSVFWLTRHECMYF